MTGRRIRLKGYRIGKAGKLIKHERRLCKHEAEAEEFETCARLKTGR